MFNLRHLQESDIDYAMELTAIAGWNQTRDDWRNFIAAEPKGCFLAEYCGQPAGTVTTIDYERRFGWIGMVLVHPDMRGRGSGKALLIKAVDYLEEKGVDTIKLDATEQGRPLYRKLGFEDEYPVLRWEITGAAHEIVNGIRAVCAEDASSIADFDTPVFGAKRAAWLTRLFSISKAYIAEKDGKISGYVMLRPGRSKWQIGPLVAADSIHAEHLMAAALNSISDQEARIDILEPNKAARTLADKFGFSLTRNVLRMYKGRNQYAGKINNHYCIAASETG